MLKILLCAACELHTGTVPQICLESSDLDETQRSKVWDLLIKRTALFGNSETVPCSFSLWFASTQGEDEPDDAKCVGCFLTSGLLVTQKQQPSLSDQEPRTTASQPAINRSWATSKAL